MDWMTVSLRVCRLWSEVDFGSSVIDTFKRNTARTDGRTDGRTNRRVNDAGATTLCRGRNETIRLERVNV